MTRTKADFKARRETLGLTQQDVADAVDVNISTVKRWEKPDYFGAPDDVWVWLDDCERAQAGVVEQAVSAALATGQGSVQITYYRTQEQYDELGRDSGPFGLANANARLVAHRLRVLGIDVEFSYPDDDGNVYHGGR